MKRKVWGAGVTGPEGRWPPSARDSQTWLDDDGTEAQVLAYRSHAHREGLSPFGSYATPTQQARGQKMRNAVFKVPTWAVGLRLIVGDCSPANAAGWWWTSAKALAEKLRGMPAGRPRVQTAAACCVAIQYAFAQDDLADPVPAAWPIVRAARWPR